MKRILVFAGTTEGREIASFLGCNKIDTLVFVATEYGETLIEENSYIKTLIGRLDSEEMADIFQQENPSAVIDATHPYAKEVTENIKKTCEITDTRYIRLLREESFADKTESVYLANIPEAVEFLNKNEGNILVTTGSKDAKEFTDIRDFQNRVFLRILPMASNLQRCIDLGFKPKNIICMQGSFTKESNEVMIDFSNAKYLVTKESGKTGGFSEKIQACNSKKILPIVIGRPKETGMSEAEVKVWLSKEFRLKAKKQVFVVSGGLGKRDFLTQQAQKAIEESNLIITTQRLYNSLGFKNKEWINEYKAEKIKDIIESSDQDKIAVIFSGDIGFFSGAKELHKILNCDVKYISGISSKVYFLNKLGKPYEDVKTMSVHGRKSNFIGQVVRNKNTVILLGGYKTVSFVCKELIKYNVEDLNIYIGENLGSDNEKIICGKPKDFVDKPSQSLEIMLIENKNLRMVTYGIADNEFNRGQVPMTKEEVRGVSISKLKLREDSIVYDIGAGTGSISCEVGNVAYSGQVYAIEKEEEAIKLIEQNKIKLRVTNVEIVWGVAPTVLHDLPIPTNVFIGGSCGKLEEILKCVLNKNPFTRIVINIISLNTLTTLLSFLKEENIDEYEIIQMTVARNRKVGSHNLMDGQNPIYVVSFNIRREGEKLE